MFPIQQKINFLPQRTVFVKVKRWIFQINPQLITQERGPASVDRDVWFNKSLQNQSIRTDGDFEIRFELLFGIFLIRYWTFSCYFPRACSVVFLTLHCYTYPSYIFWPFSTRNLHFTICFYHLQFLTVRVSYSLKIWMWSVTNVIFKFLFLSILSWHSLFYCF